MNWKKTDRGNTLISGDTFYISYNKYPGAGIAVFESDQGSDETALHTDSSPTWRVLNGDFREQYEKAFGHGLDACIEVYNKYKDNHRSSWSNDNVK